MIRAASGDRPPTARQARFVREYLVDGNATRAALRAGYSARTANQQGSRLLVNVGVAAAIAAARERVFAQLDVTAERVLREIARIAFSDVRALLDEAGAIRPVSYWSPDAAAAVRSVLKRVATTDDGAKAWVCTIQFWDKPTALALLFKHLRLDRPQEVSGQLTIRHELP